MSGSSDDPETLRRRQNIVGCVVAVGVGTSTCWLSELAVLVLSLVAAAAIVLVFATPAVRVRVVLAGSVLGGARATFRWCEHYAPLRRNAALEEVGIVALYLLSDLARGVSGEVLHVDCGYSTVPWVLM